MYIIRARLAVQQLGGLKSAELIECSRLLSGWKSYVPVNMKG
jgi:hypothetical protein